MPKALTKHFIGDSDVSFLDAPLISVPNTQIVNRAKIRDLSKDMQARMGINRIMTQHVESLQDEFGPAGESVYKILNENNNQIRLVGNWGNFNTNSGHGIFTSTIGNYAEIVFYGTGLNALIFENASARGLKASIDGGALGAELYPSNPNGVLDSRNYSGNLVLPIASGLSLGLHTIRLEYTSGAGSEFFGFEILNENTQIHIAEGSLIKDQRRVTHSSSELVDYKPSGMGSKGGRVVLYSTGSGSIKSAFRNTNASQANLTSADHSNEEVIRTYNFREFGAGRADDFSTLEDSTSDRAFTLDDGTTTLEGNNIVVTGSGDLNINSIGDFLILTFVGTGLDVSVNSSATSGNEIHEVLVDGISIGNLGPTLAIADRHTVKVVSGLPYGTHTIKITTTGIGTDLKYRDFTVYGPKKPSIPSGAVEIADYNVMADFVANTTAGIGRIATGVLRKDSLREMVYTAVGSWTAQITPGTLVGGWNTFTNTVGDKVQYTFFGTGFDARTLANTGRSNDVRVKLNGTSVTTANFPGVNINAYGVTNAYNDSTGSWDQNFGSSSPGAGLEVSNLPLAIYTLELDNQDTGYLELDAIDFIVPIHSPKINLPGSLQDTLSVGSQSIGDSRQVNRSLSELPNWARVSGVQGGTVNSTSFVPMPDMSATIKTNGNPIKIGVDVAVYSTTSTGGIYIQAYVDGIAQNPIAHKDFGATGAFDILSLNLIIPVAAGVHHVQVFWHSDAGNTATASSSRKNMIIEEMK